MGYESRIFFVERKTCFDGRVVIGSEISRFDLSKMGYYEYKGKSFREIFTQEIDFDNLAKDWTKDNEYQQTDEYIIEMIEANDYEFLEDGKQY